MLRGGEKVPLSEYLSFELYQETIVLKCYLDSKRTPLTGISMSQIYSTGSSRLTTQIRFRKPVVNRTLLDFEEIAISVVCVQWMHIWLFCD